MQLRADHVETRLPVLQSLVRENPLGQFTTAIPSATFRTIQTSHIPWVLVTNPAKPNDLGVLRGHIARNNPQFKAILAALQDASGSSKTTTLESEVCVIFTAANHYVTPKFYVHTKPATGKVVPTWNYAAVQAYGQLRVFHDNSDAETGAFLRGQVDALTDACERGIMGYTGCDGRPEPWKTDEAPERYVQLLMKGIAGLEIRLTALEGKVKMSQEMDKEDREGVVEGFEALGTDVGQCVAEYVRERGEQKDKAKLEKDRAKTE